MRFEPSRIPAMIPMRRRCCSPYHRHGGLRATGRRKQNLRRHAPPSPITTPAGGRNGDRSRTRTASPSKASPRRISPSPKTARRRPSNSSSIRSSKKSSTPSLCRPSGAARSISNSSRTPRSPAEAPGKTAIQGSPPAGALLRHDRHACRPISCAPSTPPRNSSTSR